MDGPAVASCAQLQSQKPIRKSRRIFKGLDLLEREAVMALATKMGSLSVSDIRK